MASDRDQQLGVSEGGSTNGVPKVGKAGTPIVRVAICLPFYDGPDLHTFEEYFGHMTYYGKLQERCTIREELKAKEVWDEDDGAVGVWWDDLVLPPLDSTSKTGLSELLPDDPIFEFVLISQVGWSLVGQARERCVEQALEADCDYCFFFDNDILFAKETFLRLYRHQKPVVYALAFTSREPVLPVVYKWVPETNPETGETHIDCQWLEDYPRNTLFQCDAHGAGVFLAHTDVFRTIGKGWFNSQGSGEDIHFCTKCRDHQIPLFCDSSLWTAHKPNFPMYWHDEAFYNQSQEIVSRVRQKDHTRLIMERLGATSEHN